MRRKIRQIKHPLYPNMNAKDTKVLNVLLQEINTLQEESEQILLELSLNKARREALNTAIKIIEAKYK